MKIILETKRLILRQFTQADVEAMHRIFSDMETMKFWPQPFSLEATQKWIGRAIESYEKFGFGRYAIVLKEDGTLIGDCGFIRLDINGVPENDLGYILFKEFWGKGFATEAASACLKYGIDNLHFQRVVANMETRHVDSKKVAEKIGMKLEKEFVNARNRNLPTYLLSFNASS